MNGMLLLVVLLSAAGQVLVKAGADRTLPGAAEASVTDSGTDSGAQRPNCKRCTGFFRRAMNFRLICGVACVALVPLIYTRALSDVPLSRAYGATGLTYPLVIGAGALFLREKPGIRHAVGSLLIVAGFLLWSGLPWIR
jgi:multidrug transporter EmrE-like cation transporter